MQRALWIVALWVLCACSSVVGGSQGDAAAPRADTTTPVDVYEPPVDLCGAQPIVDANAAGRRLGRRTTVRFDPSLLERGGPLPPSAGCGRALRTTHRLVLRYTPTADAYLRIQVDNDARVDRIVLLDECNETAQRLACVGTSFPSDFAYVTPLVSRGPMRAGVPVYVAVALDAGSGAVTLDEVPDVVPLGGVCDSAVLTNVCAPGSSCGSAWGPHCVPDGGPYAACRRDGARCDAGLTCVNGTADGDPGRCARQVGIGGRCDTSTQCVGSTCAWSAESPVPVCVASAEVGGLGAYCRAEGDACDAGLVCVDTEGGGRRCLRSLASGALCDSTLSHGAFVSGPGSPFCPDGEVCARSPDGLPHCARPGAAGAPCRGVVTCDPGLLCIRLPTGPTCLPPPVAGRSCMPMLAGQCDPGTVCVAPIEGGATCRVLGSRGAPCLEGTCFSSLDVCDGARCVERPPLGGECSVRLGCATGASCVAPAGEGTARCVAYGARGASCRPAGLACDAGLACNGSNLCGDIVPVGAACSASSACANATRCEGTCRPDGSEGGYCRASAPSCDTGLVCGLPEIGAIPRCARPKPCVRDASGACTPEGVPPPWCSVGGPSCATGSVCVEGECHRIAALGESCPSLNATCGPGASCDAATRRCALDGTADHRCRTTGTPCDPGLGCSRSGSTAECAPIVATGAACSFARSVCAVGDTCREGVCVRDGVLRGACRDSATPCDDGLLCSEGTCWAPLAEGALCQFSGAAPCAAGLACRFIREAARCASPSYRVEVREGVAFEDPCLVAPALLSSPLSFVLGGSTEVVTVDSNGGVSLIGPMQAGRVTTLDATTAVDVESVATAPFRGCSRVLGSAPSRRLVMASGAWAYQSASAPFVQWEVIVYEGSNEVEVRYAAPSPAGRAWVYPRLTTFLETFAAPPVRPVAGTSVRFIPR